LQNAVVICDEAGLKSNRQGAELLRLAQKHNMHVLLVGDVRQHVSVEAGDFLHVLEAHKHTGTLPGPGNSSASSRRLSCCDHANGLTGSLPEGNRRAVLDVLSEMHAKNASVLNRVGARKQLSTDLAHHITARLNQGSAGGMRNSQRHIQRI
jgi:hypothetical protein